jgi:hypothetical protein
MLRKGKWYIERDAMDCNTQENRSRVRPRTSHRKIEEETSEVDKIWNEDKKKWPRIRSGEGTL